MVIASTIAFLWWGVCQATETHLKKDIENVLAEEGLAGIAWTLVSEDGEVSVGSAGLRDNSSGSAFAPDTRFHVGSLTKALLATGVLRLATEGHIDLDAPVIRYLPPLFPDNPPASFSDITVRHLLDHTAGLNDAHMWQMFSERADPDAQLINAFPDPKIQLRVRSQPGSRFSYSNMGYTLLGMVIESVADARYESYLDEHVLAPLKMHDSTFAFTTQEGENTDPTLAWGHVDDGSRYAASAIFLRPAGQFTTTAADLARFAAFLMGDGVLDGRSFVDKAMLRSQGKPFGTEAASQGLVAGYALGLGRRDRHGVVGYCHGGNIVGFTAMFCIFPDERKAFSYSVNTDSETANYGRLDKLFIEALEVAKAPPPQTVNPASDMSRWHGRYVLSPNRFQMLEYLDTVFGAIKVSADDGLLALASLQQDARLLRPVGDYLYSANDRTTTSHVLFQGKQGEYLVSDGFRTYERVSTAYLAAHWTSIISGLAGLVWTLVTGSVSLVRFRSGALRRPEAPAFVSSALLFAPLPFFFTQSFMALGDFTIASALLAIVTGLLPIGMLSTIILATKNWRVSRMNLLHALAATFVLQWCAVLMATGMLPFRLWL
jgi:CubicO group peptidase (beta-lactamase class C family)